MESNLTEPYFPWQCHLLLFDGYIIRQLPLTYRNREREIPAIKRSHHINQNLGISAPALLLNSTSYRSFLFNRRNERFRCSYPFADVLWLRHRQRQVLPVQWASTMDSQAMKPKGLIACITQTISPVGHLRHFQSSGYHVP